MRQPTRCSRRGLLASLLPALLTLACHPGGQIIATPASPESGNAVIGSSQPLPLNGAGWTVFTASANTRQVYVSSSTGNDTNNGLTPATAKRTIAAGKALIRNGFPDWLLLKKGDSWSEAIGNWPMQGVNAAEPQLVSSYGTGPRPLLMTGSLNGMSGMGGGSRPWLAVVGIHFRGRDGAPTSAPNGMHFLTPVQGLLIEDCLFERYQTGVVVDGFDGRFQNVRLRRNVVIDNYSASLSHAAGVYFSRIDGLLLEENVIDHNGWLPSVASATGPTIFRHNVYIQNDCSDCELRGNFVMNAASHGVQMRSGGKAIGNVFATNSIALMVGRNPALPAGQDIECRDNVFLDGKDITSSLPRGWGLHAQNVSNGVISGNLFANTTQANFPMAVLFEGTISNLAVEQNAIFNWPNGFGFNGTNATFSDIRLHGNHVQDSTTSERLLRHWDPGSVSYISSSSFNSFSSTLLSANNIIQRGTTLMNVGTWRNQFGDHTSGTRQRTLLDGSRSLASYQGWLTGVSDILLFRQELRLQSKEYWRNEYTSQTVADWIRAGFGM